MLAPAGKSEGQVDGVRVALPGALVSDSNLVLFVDAVMPDCELIGFKQIQRVQNVAISQDCKGSRCLLLWGWSHLESVKHG